MTTFDGRHRVLAAINHQEPDRIPIDYWAVETVTQGLMKHFGVTCKETLLQRLNVDLRYVMGPSFAGQQFRLRDDQLIEDHWGVLRRRMTVTGADRFDRPWSWTYKQLHQSPLATFQNVGEIESYDHWPTPDLWDYSGVKAECLLAKQSGCAVVNGGDRLDRTAQLKPAMYLRSAEEFLEDLLLRPSIAQCIIEHIAAYYMQYNDRVFNAADGNIDIFFMGDDMGTQHGLWVSVDIYRRFFKENFRKYIELAHKHGMKTMYHTCGNVTEVIPDFIDCGLDILQSLQPSAMDLVQLKRDYGKDLAFQGGIDIQHLMPMGTEEDVAREVKCRAESLAHGGGYIFCSAHNLLPDVPIENIVALFEAYLAYGSYS